MRKVKYLVPAYDIAMDGVIIKQALPTQNISQVDPFLLLHHGRFKSRDRSPAIQQGLGPHPHRGFSPVTFVVDGEIQHRDSWGHNQIAKKGDVQWMNAGAGIIHSERPSEDLAQRNGHQEMVQLWINSPAAQKMNPPKYYYVKGTDMPSFNSMDGAIKSKLVSGSYEAVKGKIKADSSLLILWCESEKDGEEQFHIPHSFNAMIYVIKGEIKVDGFGKVPKKNLVIFEEADGNIEISTNGETEFLVLAGKAINEKYVQQGPFVTNSETEILEAMRDYRMGKMGVLIEE